MALADTMVVMNHGVIEQAGSPHQIYNFPKNEFVTRFMGGHNVIDTPQGRIGVRTDRIQVHNPALESTLDAQHSLRAVVSDVEYQGSYVLLGLHLHGEPRDAHATADLSVMLPEADFAAQPRALGDTVDLHWGTQDVHVLAA